MIGQMNERDNPNLKDVTNFKQFFIEQDGLKNISAEVTFSLMQKYMCKAGCHMCYLRDSWIPDQEHGALIPKDVPPDVEAAILRFVSAFDIVTTMDDLFFLKRKHPHLYEFYVRNSDRFINTSMTDNAFLQQSDLLIDELNFSAVYEITFSDTFLGKQQGKLANRVVSQLERLHAKSKVLRVKLILCAADGEDTPGVRSVIAWAKSHNIYVDVHDDFTQNRNMEHDLKHADAQNLTAWNENGQVFQILSEVVYLQYTSVFHTLNQATSATSVPFYDIMADGLDDMSKFVHASIKSKLSTYNQYLVNITNRCDNKHFDYYSYVTSSVEVSNDFNFIPAMLLKPWTAMAKILVAQGWVSTKYGLLRTSAVQNVVPLLTVRAKPKQRIYHIPIKSVPVF